MSLEEGEKLLRFVDPDTGSYELRMVPYSGGGICRTQDVIYGHGEVAH